MVYTQERHTVQRCGAGQDSSQTINPQSTPLTLAPCFLNPQIYDGFWGKAGCTGVTRSHGIGGRKGRAGDLVTGPQLGGCSGAVRHPGTGLRCHPRRRPACSLNQQPGATRRGVRQRGVHTARALGHDGEPPRELLPQHNLSLPISKDNMAHHQLDLHSPLDQPMRTHGMRVAHTQVCTIGCGTSHGYIHRGTLLHIHIGSNTYVPTRAENRCTGGPRRSSYQMK